MGAEAAEGGAGHDKTLDFGIYLSFVESVVHHFPCWILLILKNLDPS